jgi:hypothetical protein
LHLSLSRLALLILRIALAASLVSLLQDLSEGICSLLSLGVRSSVLLLSYGGGRHRAILIYSYEFFTMGFDMVFFLEDQIFIE